MQPCGGRSGRSAGCAGARLLPHTGTTPQGQGQPSQEKMPSCRASCHQQRPSSPPLKDKGGFLPLGSPPSPSAPALPLGCDWTPQPIPWASGSAGTREPSPQLLERNWRQSPPGILVTHSTGHKTPKHTKHLASVSARQPRSPWRPQRAQDARPCWQWLPGYSARQAGADLWLQPLPLHADSCPLCLRPPLLGGPGSQRTTIPTPRSSHPKTPQTNMSRRPPSNSEDSGTLGHQGTYST